MKEALKDPSFSRTKVRSIKDSPVKYQKAVEEIIATQKSIPRDATRHIATALRRAEKFNEDDKAQKLLKQDFEGLSTIEIVDKVNKIIPTEEARMKGPADVAKMISEKIVELIAALDDHPLTSLDTFSGSLVKNDLNNLGSFIKAYFQGKEKIPIKSKTDDKKLLLK